MQPAVVYTALTLLNVARNTQVITGTRGRTQPACRYYAVLYHGLEHPQVVVSLDQSSTPVTRGNCGSLIKSLTILSLIEKNVNTKISSRGSKTDVND